MTWYFALVLCYGWEAGLCTDMRIVDQDDRFTSQAACQNHGLVRQSELQRRPGWEYVIRGTLCSTVGPPSTLKPEDTVFSTGVRDQ